MKSNKQLALEIVWMYAKGILAVTVIGALVVLASFHQGATSPREEDGFGVLLLVAVGGGIYEGASRIRERRRARRLP